MCRGVMNDDWEWLLSIIQIGNLRLVEEPALSSYARIVVQNFGWAKSYDSLEKVEARS